MKYLNYISFISFFLFLSGCLFDCCNSSAPKNSAPKVIIASPVQKKNHTPVKKALGFSSPLHSYCRISSPYGYRTNPVSGNYSCHKGVDLACNKGTAIYASAAGKIISRSYDSVYGNYIIILHEGGYKTRYAHMENFSSFEAGDSVSENSVIGYAGSSGQSTGPHCHFEIIQNGSHIDPCTKVKF